MPCQQLPAPQGAIGSKLIQWASVRSLSISLQTLNKQPKWTRANILPDTMGLLSSVRSHCQTRRNDPLFLNVGGA